VGCDRQEFIARLELLLQFRNSRTKSGFVVEETLNFDRPAALRAGGDLTRFSLQSGTCGKVLRRCPFNTALLQNALSLGRMGRDRVHQRRAQAIVRLELELFQTGTYLTHALRLVA